MAARVGSAVFRVWSMVLVVWTAGMTPAAAQETAGPPTNLRAQVSGSNVLIEWDGPILPNPESYQLEASVTPGGPAAVSFHIDERHYLQVTGAPPGVYYLRVYALYTVQGVGVSEVSNEIRVVVGGGCAAPPDAPTDLEALVGSGDVPNQVYLTWVPAATGCAPTGYLLQVGTVPGASNLVTFPVPQAIGPGLAALGPPGRYYVRARSVNGYGVGAASPEVIVDIPGTCGPTPPGAPGPLTVTVGAETVGGKEVYMQWSPPASGDPPAFYEVLVGFQPGTTFLSLMAAKTNNSYGGAPPGVYYLRVRAQDVCGRNGPPSAEVVLVVP